MKKLIDSWNNKKRKEATPLPCDEKFVLSKQQNKLRRVGNVGDRRGQKRAANISYSPAISHCLDVRFGSWFSSRPR